MNIFFSKLKEKVKFLEAKEEKLAERIKMLECSHTKIELVDIPMWNMGGFSPHCFRERCTTCGKVLRTFDNESDFKKARIIKLKNQIKELEKENGDVE